MAAVTDKHAVALDAACKVFDCDALICAMESLEVALIEQERGEVVDRVRNALEVARVARAVHDARRDDGIGELFADGRAQELVTRPGGARQRCGLRQRAREALDLDTLLSDHASNAILHLGDRFAGQDAEHRRMAAFATRACFLGSLLISGCGRSGSEANEPALQAPISTAAYPPTPAAAAPPPVARIDQAALLRGALPAGVEIDLVQSRCQICHTLEYVTQQRLSDAQWDKTLTKMQKWGSPITDDDKKQLAP